MAKTGHEIIYFIQDNKNEMNTFEIQFNSDNLNTYYYHILLWFQICYGGYTSQTYLIQCVYYFPAIYNFF